MANDFPEATARQAFVAMIKDENFYMDHPYSHWSLKQHWSGAAGGFADEQLQKRWHDYLAGWKAAKEDGRAALHPQPEETK